MRELVAQLDRSSVGAAGAIFIPHQSGRQTSAVLQAAAAEADLESALTPYRKKVEPGIVALIEERDQWNLPGDTASANACLSLYIVRYSAVERPWQPQFRNDFEWWGASPRSSALGHWHNPIFVGIYEQEYPRYLPYLACPDEVVAPTSALHSVTLKEIYHIEDSEALAEFLTHNAFLHDLLIEAHGKIVEFFGEGVDVHLEVCDDPDSGGDRKLYAVIVTPLAAKDAIPLQEQFDDAWWLNNLMRAQGKFNIIVEYV